LAPRTIKSVSFWSFAADQDVSVIRAADFGTAEAERSNNLTSGVRYQQYSPSIRPS
jgi:hypothetical protein